MRRCPIRVLVVTLVAGACAEPHEDGMPLSSAPAGGTGGANGSDPAGGGTSSNTPTGGAQGDGAVPAVRVDGGADVGMEASDGGSDAGEAVPRMTVPPPVATGCVTETTAGVHEFPCDTTTHVVSVPEQCIGYACGVIVDVHGGSMSADMEDKNTNLRELGRQHGYIVIQPNALPNLLLAGARIFVAGVDDDRVLHILEDVIATFHADEDRIHMTGFSEGGFMSWRWICQHPDLLASAAPAAAGWQCTTLPITPEIGCQFTGTDVPSNPIPILFMQGTTDALVSPTCVSTWLEGNVYPVLELGDPQPVSSDATYERTVREGPTGVPFEYITHDYSTDSQFLGVPIVGHCYPGSTDFMPTLPGQLMGFGCKDDCSFHWGEEVIRFFQKHPRR